jgi:hypothetical protein
MEDNMMVGKNEMMGRDGGIVAWAAGIFNAESAEVGARKARRVWWTGEEFRSGRVKEVRRGSG